jgi:rRNA-processing protein FCF1
MKAKAKNLILIGEVKERIGGEIEDALRRLAAGKDAGDLAAYAECIAEALEKHRDKIATSDGDLKVLDGDEAYTASSVRLIYYALLIADSKGLI